jgi:hypothetical protein
MRAAVIHRLASGTETPLPDTMRPEGELTCSQYQRRGSKLRVVGECEGVGCTPARARRAQMLVVAHNLALILLRGERAEYRS